MLFNSGSNRLGTDPDADPETYDRGMDPGNRRSQEKEISKEGIVRVTHILDNTDLQTDTMIRLDNLNSMFAILECGICGDEISIPNPETVRQYLFHLGQEVDLIRQNLEQVQKCTDGGSTERTSEKGVGC